jgi:hypothetical protein
MHPDTSFNPEVLERFDADAFMRRAADHCRRELMAKATATRRAALREAVELLADGARNKKFAEVRNSILDLNGKGYGRHCGKMTMRGTALDNSHQKYIRLNCKCWDCAYCGPRKAKKYRAAIRREAERLDMRRMATFTLDPKIACVDHLGNAVEPVKYIKQVWARLRAQMCKRYGKAIPFIAVMEFQEGTGLPHLHVLLGRYVEQAWLQRCWMEAGGGQHVDIRAKKRKGQGDECAHINADAFRSAARYVAKYLTQDLLMSAPKRTRRVTVSRGVALNEKPAKTHTWVLIADSIFAMWSRCKTVAEKLEHGANGVMQSFLVPLIKLNPAALPA